MKSSKRAVNSSMRDRKSSKLKFRAGRVSAMFCECIMRGRDEDKEAEKEDGGRSTIAAMFASSVVEDGGIKLWNCVFAQGVSSVCRVCDCVLMVG